MRLPILQDEDLKRLEFKVLLGEKACNTCKGKCCKGFPGDTVPKQWKVDGKINWKKIKQALISKMWVVDCIYIDYQNADSIHGNAPFIRPAHESSKYVLDTDIPFDLRTACTFLGDSGCTLPVSDRPAGCTLLIPYLVESEDGLDTLCGYPPEIGAPTFKYFAAKSWFPYRSELLAIADEAQAHIDKEESCTKK